MKVVTCVSDVARPDYQELWKASASYHGLESVTLHYRGEWISHRIKDYLLWLYVRRIRDTELVVFTDGYGAMWLRSAEEIEARFSSFSTPIVFASSPHCRPYAPLALAYPFAAKRWRFLSVGAFIGRARDLCDVLSDLADNLPSIAQIGDRVSLDGAAAGDVDQAFIRSNQYPWSLLYLLRPDLISLDMDHRLFLDLRTKSDGDEAQPPPREGDDVAQRHAASGPPTTDDGVLAARREQQRETSALPCLVLVDTLAEGAIPNHSLAHDLLALVRHSRWTHIAGIRAHAARPVIARVLDPHDKRAQPYRGTWPTY